MAAHEIEKYPISVGSDGKRDGCGTPTMSLRMRRQHRGWTDNESLLLRSLPSISDVAVVDHTTRGSCLGPLGP